jgi:hypothetical protein
LVKNVDNEVLRMEVLEAAKDLDILLARGYRRESILNFILIIPSKLEKLALPGSLQR